MTRLLIFAAAMFLLTAAASISPADAQTPPSISVRFNTTFTNVQPPARNFNLIQGVSEFLSGEAARTNFTAGPRFFTALEGELTVLIGDKTEVFGAGKTWSVPGGMYFGIKNEGSSRARVFFSALAPIGSLGAQPQPGSVVPASPGRILQTVQAPVTVRSDTLNVVQVVQDWPGGARNTNHMMNQPHVYGMLEGENTTRFLDGSNERWTAGQAGVMAVGKPGYMENSGATANRVFFTWVVTPGTPQTLPATAPASAAPATAPITPPRTGDAGLVAAAHARETVAGLILLAVVTVGVALATKHYLSRHIASSTSR